MMTRAGKQRQTQKKIVVDFSKFCSKQLITTLHNGSQFYSTKLISFCIFFKVYLAYM